MLIFMVINIMVMSMAMVVAMWSGDGAKRSRKDYFLGVMKSQFLWDLIESDLANAEHLGRWFIVTVWT